ncbi:MAG: hypothetical protein AB7N71_01375 [Phycisphaerae bacterium]
MRLLCLFLSLALVTSNDPRAHGFQRDEAVSANPDSVPVLIQRLGNEAFEVREAATEALIGRGTEIIGELENQLAVTEDLEVRLRLQYIIENVAPPQEAVLVVRDSESADLRSGDLITHLSGRRIRDLTGLYSRLRENDAGALLRVRRDNSPIEVGPVHQQDLPTMADYRLPNGPVIREALKLYRTGFAERAAALLDSLEEFTATELNDALRGIILYTAGFGARGRAYITPEMLAPPEGRLTWTNLSGLDRAGPLRAPLVFEASAFESNAIRDLRMEEPDLAVQRVEIPGNRLMQAAASAALIWWRDHAGAFDSARGPDRVAGNMLAIVAWMLSDLDLVSECIELIEPRSTILGSKWVRVHSDGWLDFLRNNAQQALDRFWNDAYAILANPPAETDMRYVTRNPQVASSIGFFLYQAPTEERRAEMTALVQDDEFPATQKYLEWMFFGLNVRNEAAIRADLTTMLPQLEGEAANQVAFALLLLTYIAPSPDEAIFASAKERLNLAVNDELRQLNVAIGNVLHALSQGKLSDARAALEVIPPDDHRLDQLRQTCDFLVTHATHPLLSESTNWPLMAVRQSENCWVVITRDRRIGYFQPSHNEYDLLPPITADWFPGVANWPWLGNSDAHNRTWAYDRRRVIEIPTPSGTGDVFRANVHSDQIAIFDALIAPVFPLVQDAVAKRPAPRGETGEFLRRDIQANADYVSDPDLPEIAVIEGFEATPELVHVAFRGGPQMLIDVPRRRVWTSDWFAEQLKLEKPPVFFPQALRAGEEVLLFLHSAAGLIRFAPATEAVRRIPLPGDEPYPLVIPESCPYDRADSRWVYTARLPEDGGRVYRVATTGDAVEALQMINVVQPASFFRLRSRAELRDSLDLLFQESGIPPLQEFIDDARRRVSEWEQGL